MDVKQFKLPEAVTNFGLIGERKAISLLCLGFFTSVLGLMALVASSQMPEWTACFAGLGACYAIGFFAIAADWFWARWYAVGLGYSGVTMAILSFVTTRELSTPMIVFGVLHGIIALCLLGPKMAERYEVRADWRARWKLDEQGVLKVRRAVTRAASSLPSLIMFALAPRDGAEAIALLALGVIGFAGLVRGRTWGLLALVGAGVGSLGAFLFAPAVDTFGVNAFGISAIGPATVQFSAFIAGAFLLAAVAPFLPAMGAYIARRRD